MWDGPFYMAPYHNQKKKAFYGVVRDYTELNILVKLLHQITHD